MKNLNISVLIGLLGILFIIWNRLRDRLPQSVPIELNNKILEIGLNFLMILLGMMLILKIKNLIYPKESSKFVEKIKALFEKPITLFKEVEKEFYGDLAKYFYEIV
jgi:hypothetical protein